MDAESKEKITVSSKRNITSVTVETEKLKKNEELSVYHHGDTWYDLCRGPHLTSSSKIGKAFKLTKVSGAYWRGDSKKEMLFSLALLIINLTDWSPIPLLGKLITLSKERSSL